jgi:hypothetical protein
MDIIFSIPMTMSSYVHRSEHGGVRCPQGMETQNTNGHWQMDFMRWWVAETARIDASTGHKSERHRSSQSFCGLVARHCSRPTQSAEIRSRVAHRRIRQRSLRTVCSLCGPVNPDKEIALRSERARCPALAVTREAEGAEPSSPRNSCPHKCLLLSAIQVEDRSGALARMG